MRNSKTPSLRRMSWATGMLLVLGAIIVLPGRLQAQEPRAPTDREPATPPPVRTRVNRLPPAEYMSTPAPEGTPLRSLAPTLRPPTAVAPAHFEVTVYEVLVPEARIAELEALALEAKAATAQELAKALGEFGQTKVLYRIDQTVNLYGENITLGSNEPMVTGVRRQEPGSTINTITYQHVGLIVSLAANPPVPDAPRKELNVQVNLELAALADSGIEIAPQVKASRIRNLQLSHSETPRFGRPWVLLNVSAPPAGDKTPPVAYVVRYVFREVKP